MRKIRLFTPRNICFKIILLSGFVLLLGHLPVKGQALSVYTVQNLSFGAFFQGTTGGTVSVSHDGSRSVSGDIIGADLGFTYYPAIIEVEVAASSTISILNGSDVSLTGSNGGSMILSIDDTDVGSPFNTTAEPPARTTVRVGASLTVGTPAANPTGNYSGTFEVTFILE